ncbi:MAG TPA: hypothetical protein VF131_07965 [Blastocatellia bacterium]|nr:hypothetical protein [Blastocatellia bacterium]
MGIISILRIAGFLALILGAAILATLFPDLLKLPSLPSGKSDTLSKTSYRAASLPRIDPRLSLIDEAARRTSPEGKVVIEKARLATPEFDRRRATRTLEAMIEEAAMADGLRRIEPLGWDASEMKDGKWRLNFHYHRWPALYLVAEWEYDAKANKLRLLDSQQGPEFWMTVANLHELRNP